MHSQSTCDCYCKSRMPTKSEKNRTKLLTSKSSVSRTDTVRSAKKIPTTPATVVDEDQPGTKRSTITPSVSPALSPETSAVLEDVEKLVKDAQIQIKGINMAVNSNRVEKNVNAYQDEVTLDDENDQLLYVRERVAHKFQEANGWICTNYDDSKTQEVLNEGRPLVRPKRTTDYSAPKFKMSETYCKEFSPYGALFGNPGFATQIANDVAENDDKAKNPNGSSCREAGKIKRTSTFAVQVGPSVNIQRGLIAQNLENIRIPPDPFFIQESTNVGIYMLCHDHWKQNGCSAPKEKFMKIPEELRRINARPTSDKQARKNSKQVNEDGKIVDSASTSTSKERSEISEGDDYDLMKNNGTSANSEKLDEVKNVTAALENEKSSNDVAVGLDDEESKKDQKVELVETVKEETDNLRKAISGIKNDLKQVRFEEEVLKETEHPVKAQNCETTMLEQGLQIPKHVESEDRDVEGFNEPSTSKEIISKETEDSRKKTFKKDERHKIVDERFASILRKYHVQEIDSTNDSLVSLSTNSSAEGLKESEDLDNLYYPSIDKLDNVLTVYDKIINDVSRSTRTIDKFLSRPELEEYYIQEKSTMETSESLDFEISKSKVEKTSSVHSSKTKPNPDPRRKDPIIKERLPAASKRAGKEYRPHGAKILKPASTRMSMRVSRDQDSRKKSTSSRSFKVPVRNESNEESSESNESDESNDKIARHVEAKKSCFSNQSSSLTASSGNPLSSNTNVQSSNDAAASQTISKSIVDATEDRRLRPRVTSTQEIEKIILQKGGFDDKTLYDVVCSDIVKRGFPESRDPRNMAERLINSALEEETRFIEDKIKNAFDENWIKSLLQHLQNDAPTTQAQNLELLISENASVNDTVSANIHAAETARMKSEFEERNVKLECLRTGERDNNSNEFGCKNVGPEPDSSSKSHSSVVVEEASHANFEGSSVKETSRIETNVESLKQSSRKSPPIHVVDERTENDVNGTVKSMEVVETQIVNENANSWAEQSILEPIGSSTMRENVKSMPCKDSILIPEVKIEKSLELRLIQGTTKIPEQSLDNVTRVSSADSLRDCVSLESSPRNVSKTLSNMAEPTREDNEIKLSQTSNAHDGDPNEIMNQKSSYCGNIFTKERILSDLYDDVHKKLLFSTMETNYSSAVDQNYRLSNSVSAVKSNKIETFSSDTSRSEGELCIPSSGSYSLGEVKILNTDGRDSNVTILITKEMLNSWNESSKSLIQSMGEI
ncbi:uncharacterized protein LOC122402157 isoform X2 [Colletes gigas]|nr:uncharacterized protein LOC122402157 isoform X2 [Colletes gigas]XP_043260698.1 uncharacterized protein LOC122402157 isoform X2 [Colletes gigas]